MTRSMTGYGQARWQGEGCAIFVEVRSVNGRHLKLNTRVPHEMVGAEHDLEKVVRRYVTRGSLDLYVRVERTGAQAARPINQDALACYIRQLQEATEDMPGAGSFHLDALLSLPGVLEGEGALDGGDGTVDAQVQATVEQALEALDKMRQVEGAHLRQALLEHCKQLEEGTAKVEEAQPQALEGYGERLAARVNRMLANSGISVTERDLAREIAIFVDRSAICEEVQRLRSHLKQFRDTLEQDKPVGRHLEFLGAEIHREVNTMGSKVSDADLSRLVGQLRIETDGIREQVMNVE
ncbi:MAG: YicC family protein [Candidatus Brocadiae bacterium]|nr:YicC family protein [Candidatus Brocadiia bacterium]